MKEINRQGAKDAKERKREEEKREGKTNYSGKILLELFLSSLFLFLAFLAFLAPWRFLIFLY